MAKRKARERLAPRNTPPKPDQPNSDEQSGSTGRNTAAEKLQPDKDTGQDHYGQSGFAGGASHETVGQANYRKSDPASGPKREPDSNRGSGRAEREADEYQNAKGDKHPRASPK